MDTNDGVENIEFIVDNEQLNIEQIEPNIYISETNINFNTNNITNTTETNPLALPYDNDENYGLPPCYVKLTRCDNIWKTLQLIRDFQGDDETSECSDNDDNDDNDDNNDDNDDDDNTEKPDENDEPASSMNDSESYSSSTQANNTMAPYIKYQPVLNNGNSALNFQFSVKSTRLLYQCHECGKQYSHRSTLRDHSEKIHNIILPIIRKKPENTNNDSKNIQLKTSNNDFNENNSVNRDEFSSVSSETHENSTNSLQDDGALLDNISDTYSSDKISIVGGREIYTCQYCNRQYKDKYYFNYHLKTTHGLSIKGIRTYNKRSKNNDTSEQPAKKTRRVQQVEQLRDLNVHRCNTCGKHFYDKARLGQHQRKVHGIYARSLKQRNRLNNRLQSNKSNSNHKTTTTQQSSSSSPSSSKNTANLQLNDARKVNPCLFCEKVYVDRSSWKCHLQKVHDIIFAPFNRLPREKKGCLIPCKECDRKYICRRSLIEHLFTVHGKRLQHQCETCGLWFQNSDGLIKHSLDIHKIMLIQRIVRRTKTRPFKCQVCFTHYGLKKNLMWHLMEAHGIKTNDQAKYTEITNIMTAAVKSTANKKSTASKKARKGLRDKTRINYNEAPESRAVEQILLGDAINNTENVDTTEKENSGNIILCFLCQRRCIKIRRHFIEYHKIRHPEALIAQCKVISTTSTPTPTSSSSSSSTGVANNNNVNNRTKSKTTNKNKKKKNSNLNLNHSIHRNNRRNINPNRLFLRVLTETGRYYKCKICPDYSRDSYEELRRHEKLHKRQKVHLPIDPEEIVLVKKVVPSKKRKRTSIDTRETRRPRLSDSIEHARTTRAATKFKETREFRCCVCDRLFRNAEILSSHKISCMAYHGENSSMNDASDTRESSDRDSGIGISITIKKKNNSYEIVGREDGNEDEKLINLDEKNSGESKEDRSVSDNSSDAFAIVANKKINEADDSCPYSKDHCVMKIQKVEDTDVDIDLDSITNSPINIECENNQEVTSSVQDDDDTIEILNVNQGKGPRILSLRQLCENILITVKNSDTYPYRCRLCSKCWPTVASRNAHMRAHTNPLLLS